MGRPNFLLIMTDEERYPPAYESPALAAFRSQQLPARRRLRERGLELHRHYAASTACTPSRASLFTGQYPSLHGVTSTDGMAKRAFDPEHYVLEPDSVPTAGHWLRAAGYRTFYKGKWHVSHPDLRAPGTLEGLAASDRRGRLLPEVVELYRRTGRLEPFGFSGWIGREPHGASPADLGYHRDPIFADQVCAVFDALEAEASQEPWLLVASLVNPHDIFAAGVPWRYFGLPLPDDDVPEIDPAPSEEDSLEGRPAAHAAYRELLPKMMLPQEHDGAYRRFYYWLHKLVDREIGRILERFESSRFAADTFVLFTSDHGDLLGSHGGLAQKWYCAYDEATRVPMVFSGPGIRPGGPGLGIATSHADLLPTLLGLAEVDVEVARARLDQTHTEVHELVGRDLSALLLGRVREAELEAPIYFMTEDQMSRGAHQTNRISGEAYAAVPEPANIESVLARMPTGPAGALELWKLNHYYERLCDWERERGVPPAASPGRPRNEAAPAPAESEWELFNLAADPDERRSRVADDPAAFSSLKSLLERARDAHRRLPRHRNEV